MSELNYFTVWLMGFFSYPAIKWLTLAIWDKIVIDCERITRPEEQ